ncbi:hypothetical protein Tco_0953068 [Tanacetum coccineum]|uniref:Uncharacterized protein n=1 Tax=Tanacetum coccineum TaxID=301880 RepID=A0ABQ5E1M8_9ASTR
MKARDQDHKIRTLEECYPSIFKHDEQSHYNKKRHRQDQEGKAQLSISSTIGEDKSNSKITYQNVNVEEIKEHLNIRGDC